jgi:hypothetical protein
MIIALFKRMHEKNCIEWKYGILVGKDEDTEGKSHVAIEVYRSEQAGKHNCCL